LQGAEASETGGIQKRGTSGCRYRMRGGKENVSPPQVEEKTASFRGKVQKS
jgi:hypothetical protein